MNNYTLELVPSCYEKRDRIRKIMLAVSILLDLTCIALIITAIISPIYWIAVVGLAILSNAIRYIVNIYPIKYVYGIRQDNLFVNKVSPLRTEKIIDIEEKDILSITKIEVEDIFSKNNDNAILIYDNSCKNDVYMIEFSGKRIIMPLDEYLYTLIKSGMKIEERE